jgi:hypothetical protein
LELEGTVQVGEKLPPLNRDGDGDGDGDGGGGGGGGQALNQYLRRRKVWMALRDDAQ